MRGLPKCSGALHARNRTSLGCMDASDLAVCWRQRRLRDGDSSTSVSSWRGASRSAPSPTSSTCCGSPPTRATARGRSSAPGGCCRRRWTRSRRAAASSSSPTSGSAIRRASTISSSSAGSSTRSRTCIPTPCASSSAPRRPACRWSGSAPAPSPCTGAGLMQGYRACVSWFHHEDFLERFDGLEPVSDQIFVVDRDRLTCSGGVSLGASRGLHRRAPPRAGAGGEEPAHHDHRRGDGGGGAAARHAARARHRRRAGAEGAAR